jgi:hypothetical protein
MSIIIQGQTKKKQIILNQIECQKKKLFDCQNQPNDDLADFVNQKYPICDTLSLI